MIAQAAATEFPIVDLRDAVRRAPLELPGLETYSPEDISLARDQWRIHMAAEFVSARVFAGLVPQMMAASLPFDEVREVTEMVRQEVDHGLLSGRVYAALGGEPCSALPPLPPVPAHEECTPLEAVLRNIISVSCCNETLAVAEVSSERERVTIEPLRQILTNILSDEIGHSRFGWRLLRDLSVGMDPEMKRRLSAYLVSIFERDLRALARSHEAPSASWAALSVGAHDGELARTTYLETMTSVTIPGLERYGLKATWAFERAKERALS